MNYRNVFSVLRVLFAPASFWDVHAKGLRGFHQNLRKWQILHAMVEFWFMTEAGDHAGTRGHHA
jgi:hypothetical protein